jgi:hypothetical protein
MALHHWQLILGMMLGASFLIYVAGGSFLPKEE